MKTEPIIHIVLKTKYFGCPWVMVWSCFIGGIFWLPSGGNRAVTVRKLRRRICICCGRPSRRSPVLSGACLDFPHVFFQRHSNNGVLPRRDVELSIAYTYHGRRVMTYHVYHNTHHRVSLCISPDESIHSGKICET